MTKERKIEGGRKEERGRDGGKERERTAEDALRLEERE